MKNDIAKQLKEGKIDAEKARGFLDTLEKNQAKARGTYYVAQLEKLTDEGREKYRDAIRRQDGDGYKALLKLEDDVMEAEMEELYTQLLRLSPQEQIEATKNLAPEEQRILRRIDKEMLEAEEDKQKLLDKMYENEQTSDGIVGSILLYAKALGTDPVTAFDRMFTGQRIEKITNDAIIVYRMPLEESRDIRQAWGATNEVELDHIIPLSLGGSNEAENLELVPVALHAEYTRIGNILRRALVADVIDKDEAQRLMVGFRNGTISEEELLKTINAR